jgi:hypothetical protein
MTRKASLMTKLRQLSIHENIMPSIGEKSHETTVVQS